MSEKPKSKAKPRPSERKAQKAAEPETPLRKYYLLAALFFFVGDVAAIADEAFVSTIVFTVLTLMMLWIAWRVDRFIENRRPSDRPGAKPQR
jgi:hypothetical protein